MSNVAEELKNPGRDFHRSIPLSVLIISALYVSVAIAAVGSRAYEAGGSIAPFAAMLSNALGLYGAIGAAILAVIIIFGTVNAYTTGMSRVIYATAKEGGLPRILSRIDAKSGVPRSSLGLLLGLSWLSLAFFYFFNATLETALLIPSGAAILVYVVGSASGIKLLHGKGWRGLLPWISLGVSLIMLPFVGVFLLISIAVAIAGLLYRGGVKSSPNRGSAGEN